MKWRELDLWRVICLKIGWEKTLGFGRELNPRYHSEHDYPNLLEDIKKIVEPISQTDPTFHTTNLYSPITAKEVHRRLIKEMNYSPESLPTIRTISNKLNQLGFKLKKVTKCKPKKK